MELVGQWRERLTQQIAVETPDIKVGFEAKAATPATVNSSLDDLKCASLLRRRKTLKEEVERPKSGMERPSSPKFSANEISKKWNSSSLGGDVQDWRRGLTRTRSLMHTRRPSSSVWA